MLRDAPLYGDYKSPVSMKIEFKVRLLPFGFAQDERTPFLAPHQVREYTKDIKPGIYSVVV